MCQTLPWNLHGIILHVSNTSFLSWMSCCPDDYLMPRRRQLRRRSGIMCYKVSRLCSTESRTFGTGCLSGGGPLVAFTEPRVPLVLTFGSGRPVTGPGVEQATASRSASAIDNFFMIYGLIRWPYSCYANGRPRLWGPLSLFQKHFLSCEIRGSVDDGQ